MKKPYDDFNKIPELKDLTPWDSIHLEKHFFDYLLSFTPETTKMIPYYDRYALWFGDEFAMLFRINQTEPKLVNGNVVVKRMIVTDGALISNGIQIKEVLNANLKFKKCRRVQFDMRRGLYNVLNNLNIKDIDGVSTHTLNIGTWADVGVKVDAATEQTIKERVQDNRNVPEPLIKVKDTPCASHKSILRQKGSRG